MAANRQQRRLAKRICRKDGHLFKVVPDTAPQVAPPQRCARCGAYKKEQH